MSFEVTTLKGLSSEIYIYFILFLSLFLLGSGNIGGLQGESASNFLLCC